MPDSSVTLHVTMVVSVGKVAGASLFIVSDDKQLSSTDGEFRITPFAPHIPGLVKIVVSEGQVITGSSLSIIVTMALHTHHCCR